MKRMLTAFVALSVLVLAGCKGTSNDPKAVVTAFFEALGKKDIAAAKKLATKESEAMLGMMEMAMKMGGDKEMEKFDIKKMTIGEPKIEGDKATVEITENGKSQSTKIPLKKEDGNWKVAFDKSMMTSNMDKIDEGMDKAKEGINAANEAIKSVNADSLKDALKEGTKELEKATEELKKLGDK